MQDQDSGHDCVFRVDEETSPPQVPVPVRERIRSIVRRAGEEPCRSAGGRRRDADRDPEILRAALEVLAETGYDRLTMDAVAARARAGKATLYRRWSSKEALIAEASLCARDGEEDAEVPDTGSLRGDLLAFLESHGDVPDEGGLRGVLALLPVITSNPGLADLVRTRFVTQWQTTLRAPLERARERGSGEVHPDRDLDGLALVLPAMAFYRTAFGSEPFDADMMRGIVDDIVLPLASAPPGRGA